MPSPLPPAEAPPPQGSFPPAAFFFTAILGTTSPSDSRCAPPAFALGLYGRSLPDVGCADGPLVFRTAPSARAAPHTPPRLGAYPDFPALCMAFAVTCLARLSDSWCDDAAGPPAGPAAMPSRRTTLQQ